MNLEVYNKCCNGPYVLMLMGTHHHSKAWLPSLTCCEDFDVLRFMDQHGTAHEGAKYIRFVGETTHNKHQAYLTKLVIISMSSG